MENSFTHEDRRQIRTGIWEKFRKVATSPEGRFKYPTGRAGIEGLKYDPEIVKTLPEEIVDSYCGVGNPFSLGPLLKGDAVLDIGCGAGVDSLIAAIMVGPAGRVVGMDLTPKMLDRARENLRRTSLENVSFREGSAENLPFPD